LAIIASGELVEAGKSIDLYENPMRRFTADFIGENNIFDGRVTKIDGAEVTIDLGYGAVTANSRGQPIHVGDDASVSVRSERLRVFDAGGADEESFQCLPATHMETVYLGLTISELLTLPDGNEVMVRRLSDGAGIAGISRGEGVRIGWRKADGRIHTS